MGPDLEDTLATLNVFRTQVDYWFRYMGYNDSTFQGLLAYVEQTLRYIDEENWARVRARKDTNVTNKD